MTRYACLAAALAALSPPALSQPSTPAVSPIYKCVESDGSVTYQESACPRSARGGALALDPAPAPGVARGIRSAPPLQLAARQPSMGDMEREVRRMELDRRKRAIGFDIDALEREIRGHQENLDRELREMREQQMRAAANPFEPGRPQPTAADMLAVSQRYQGRIAMAQDRIAVLQQEARRLEATLVR